ncbi:MAG: adenine glycosylase [Atopobiaceae bacterium]|nr:adenine glycosylase [Atopobiaceae bacterium]
MRDFANTDDFRRLVLERGRELYRDLPWRRTHDPYGIWVSEVMLQQTQVARVDGRWQRWLARFPSIDALANAEVADVLEEWQGMGYNRRALSLRAAAQAMVDGGGEMPSDERELVALPGIGPATAAGIRAFAFDLPATYLETNVRTVFLHELFSDAEDVPDSALLPLVRETCPKDAGNPDDDPRTWYYALLDYGAHLKRTVPNPSRRSRSHVRQTRFEGSHRQKRAEVVRLLLEARQLDGGLTPDQVVDGLSQAEVAAGREMPDPREVLGILDELAAEGFCSLERGTWRV